MDFNLSLALEKRLKVLPNKATVGVQVTMQDSNKLRSQISNRKNSIQDRSVLLSTSTHKDAKIGTELIQSSNQTVNQVKSQNQSLKYRLKGVLAEGSNEIYSIEKTNRFLRVELLRARKILLKKMILTNERPLGTPKSIKFDPVCVPSPVQAEGKKTRKIFSPNSSTGEIVNFISHNKQTLFNIKASSPRPVTDKGWVKSMRKNVFFQKHKSVDESVFEDGKNEFEWKNRPDSGITLNMVDFSGFNGEIMVTPSYAYCGCCRKGTAPISLRGKNMRPRLNLNKSL